MFKANNLGNYSLSIIKRALLTKNNNLPIKNNTCLALSLKVNSGQFQHHPVTKSLAYSIIPQMYHSTIVVLKLPELHMTIYKNILIQSYELQIATAAHSKNYDT